MNTQELLNRSRFKPYQLDRAEELLKLPKLGKDDTFTFGCNECGKCCRNREDILLMPLDLFKIAKHLETTITDVIDDYCEFYEGQVSKVPVVRIKPKEYRKTCPFCKAGKCIIHAQKPAVCALFPLGRMTNSETKEFTYFKQEGICGNQTQTHTVREWLSMFDMIEDEPITILWHQKIGELSEMLCRIYKNLDFNHDAINSMLFINLYLRYDLEQDFLPQFEANCDEALRLVKEIEKIKEMVV
jgi:Fe-S-cluster containining protein